MNSYVVVFPSPFARSKSALLASNVKKILKVKELAYDSIRRDGQIIIVDAKDPVFASSAIGLLYGIERVAIAKKVGNGFDETVKEMAKVGSSLLSISFSNVGIPLPKETFEIMPNCKKISMHLQCSSIQLAASRVITGVTVKEVGDGTSLKPVFALDVFCQKQVCLPFDLLYNAWMFFIISSKDAFGHFLFIIRKCFSNVKYCCNIRTPQ